MPPLLSAGSWIFMELVIRRFEELSPEESWAIYLLRQQVFMVEQGCVSEPDIDIFDKTALHVYLKDEDGIEAYARVLPAGTVCSTASVGRVISVKRRQGLGTRIMREALKAAEERFGAEDVTVHAQVYVKRLYEKLGFVPEGEEFSEVGIPHVTMVRRKSSLNTRKN